jgi:hypothetical protein
MLTIDYVQVRNPTPRKFVLLNVWGPTNNLKQKTRGANAYLTRGMP